MKSPVHSCGLLKKIFLIFKNVPLKIPVLKPELTRAFFGFTWLIFHGSSSMKWFTWLHYLSKSSIQAFLLWKIFTPTDSAVFKLVSQQHPDVRLMSPKRWVRAAHGRLARPNPICSYYTPSVSFAVQCFLACIYYYLWIWNPTHASLVLPAYLMGQCHEIFRFRFFLNHLPPSPWK